MHKAAGFAGKLRRKVFFPRIPPEMVEHFPGIDLSFADVRVAPSLDFTKEETRVRGRFAAAGFVAPGCLRGGFAEGSRRVRYEPGRRSQKGLAEGSRKVSAKGFAKVVPKGFAKGFATGVRSRFPKSVRCLFVGRVCESLG